MMVGEFDPLLDDSLRLCEKMSDSGVDVKLRIYRELSHGFLSVENMISEGERGILDSIEILKELFGKK
jgi:acetyl esterase/lipase